MNDIERVKQRKLMRLMQQQAEKYSAPVHEAEELQQQVLQLELLIKPLLSKDAWSRYSTLKIAHPERALQALMALAHMAQTGSVRQALTDEQFKQVLIQLNNQR